MEDIMNTKTITISLNDYENTYDNVSDVGEIIAGFIEETEVLCETNSPACECYDSGEELLFEEPFDEFVFEPSVD